jgi:DNA-binding LacI/PurR family transcriptional regulator
LETGRPLDDLVLVVCARNSAAEGEAAVAGLLARAGAPDAIAAMSDELAVGALRALTTAELAVPDAVAVTGWDDGDAAARAGLTTVAQSLRDQGARCARLALGRPAEPQDGQPEWRVVVRSTTRPA